MHLGTIRCAASIGLSLALFGAEAAAHGGLWRAVDIHVEPSDADHIVLRSDVWGLIQTKDGGETWEWVCAEAFGANSTTKLRLGLDILPGGTILVANLFDGLAIAPQGNFCGFSEHEAFAGELVEDVTVHVDGASAEAFVLTSTGGSDGITVKVWRSSDGAQTFETVATLPGSFSGKGIRVAPSDGDRIYVSGKTSENVAAVQRSDDGGQTWTLNELSAADGGEIRLLGVGPADPDHVFVMNDINQYRSGPQPPDEIYFSPDGGSTFEQVFVGREDEQFKGDLPGFAFSPDGSEVLVAGPSDGLWLAETASLADEKQNAFEQRSDRPIWGLSWSEDSLLTGNDDFAAPAAERYSLSASSDRGASFEERFEICDVRMTECGPDTTAGAICPMKWSEPQGFEDDMLVSKGCPGLGAAADAGTADGGRPADAGTMPDPREPSGGCSCHAAKGASGTFGGLASLLLAAAVALRRARSPSRGDNVGKS